MDTSRRWLGIFALAVTIIAVVTLVMVLVSGNSQVDLLNENSPEGIVQRYLLAIQERGWEQAYAYLSFDSVRKLENYEDWLQTVPLASGQSSWKAALGSVIYRGDQASVAVAIDTFRPSWLFEDPVNTQQILFELIQTGGKWLIASPVYIYWVY